MSAYFQHATVEEKRWFRCSYCQHEQGALVRGVGQGSATSLNFELHETAARRAQADAHKDVERTLAIAPCPKCGRRNPLAVRKWWLAHLAPALIVLAVVLAMGWAPSVIDLNMRGSDAWLAGWIMTGIGIFSAGLAVLLHAVPKWATSSARISWPALQP